VIGEARRLPIGTGSVIDRRRLLDLVDQLRAAVPAEVREAQDVLDRKDEVLAQADEEVALRLARADEEVERRISESEITRAAEVRAEQIIAGANDEAERIREDARMHADAKRAEGERLAGEQMDEADRYAMEMLRKLEQQLDAFTASVRAGIETLDRSPEPATDQQAYQPQSIAYEPGKPAEPSYVGADPLREPSQFEEEGSRYAEPPTVSIPPPPALDPPPQGPPPSEEPASPPDQVLEPPERMPPAEGRDDQDDLLQRTS